MNKLDIISTNNLINLLIQMDNGLFDNEIEYFNKYDSFEKYRNNIISILFNRYSEYIESNKKNIACDDLEKAYETYLRFYL